MTTTNVCLRKRRSIPRNGTALLLTLAASLSGALSAHAAVGVSWNLVRTDAEWQERLAQAAVVYAGKMWILGGAIDGAYTSLHDVWSSGDGITWTQETAAAGWPARHTFCALSFGGKLWIMGGQLGVGGSTIYSDVWSSTNGQSWTQATANAQWGARFGLGAVVHGGKMFVLGGYNGTSDLHDVWSSTDGATWTLVTAAAPWPARTTASVVEYNSKIWVLGGYSYISGTEFNDVWSSTDGQTWTQVSSGAGWTARDSMAAEVYNGRLWMMGGYPTSADVWSTTNGSAWAQATGGAEWPPRLSHSTLVFDNKLWVMGGVGNSIIRNDVWYTTAFGSVRGRVTDATTNAAVGCAAIVATSGALSSPRVTTADVNGNYRLDDLPVGSYTITAYATGHANKTASVTVAEGDRVFTNLVVAQSNLSNGVRGTVTDAVTHAPIPGIRVVAKIGGSAVATTFTCAEGLYEILGLAVKTTAVTVEFTGAAYTTATQTVQVAPGAVVQADKALSKSVPAPGALVGVVVRSGTATAINGARVTIEGLGNITTATDSSGAYAFSSLPEGTYTVHASAAGYGGQTQLSTVAALGTTPLDFDLPLTSPSDVNQSSSVNATDVQLVINAALGLPGPYNCDISKDGVVNAIDVQLVINAALGLKEK